MFSYWAAPNEGCRRGDPCGMYNYSIIIVSDNRSTRSWLMNTLNLLAPMGGDRHSQPTNGVPGVGVSKPCGAVSTPDITVFVPGSLELYMYGMIYDPGMDPILPGCRWLHKLQPISDRPVGLGFPHRAGRYRLGGPPFSSSIHRSCRGTEIFLIREWDPILPGWP